MGILREMDIIVYYKEMNDNRLLPKPLRSLIVGSSGCGKTNVVLNLIYNKEGVAYDNLYIFSRSIDQPAYKELREVFKRMETRLGREIGYFFSNCEDLITVDDCKPNSFVVFDDCVLNEQIKIKDYFVRGRHKQISCAYLSQSYGCVDMQVIRNNVNLLIVFNQNKHYCKRIYDDFVGSDMSYDSFEKICNKCWSKPYGFIAIDATKKSHSGKYRCMLKEIIKPT